MTYSGAGKYRGSSGTLTVGGGSLVFSRSDGLISKKQRIVISIPSDAIVDVNVEGLIGKKLVVLVDKVRVPGIPRHEFSVSDPHQWVNAIRNDMNISRTETQQTQYQQPPPQPQPPQQQVYVKETVKEIIKIPCTYCKTLNEITEAKCCGCGASIGN